MASTPRSADGRAGAQPPARARGRLARLGGVLGRHPVVRHLVILAAYLAAGIAVTWPRATYLTEGKLQATRDAGVYVWDFWWVARQVEHFADPWFTRSLAAPAGGELGYHALMPLAGVVMLPVTAAFGPSASYNLLSILMPGLLCYAMYRVARLWLRSQAGAIAAGGFFGLSGDMAWHAWYQLNLAAGVLFLPLAAEAAVRLRRQPGWRQAVVLGVVVGASLLVDQESAVLVVILTAAVLLPWLLQSRAAPRPAAAGSAGTRPGADGHAWTLAAANAAANGTAGTASAPNAANRASGSAAASAARRLRGALRARPWARLRAWPRAHLRARLRARLRLRPWARRQARPHARARNSPLARLRARLWAGLRAWPRPWLRALPRKLAVLVGVAVAALVVASPQIIAMHAQSRSGGAALPSRLVYQYYTTSGVTLPGVFAVSPQAIHHGLTALRPAAYNGRIGDGVLTYGLVLSVLAVVGLAVSWRRRSAWLLALGWLAVTALALGSTLRIGSHTFVPASQLWNDTRVSTVMPFSWFVKIPGLSGFREAARLLMLGFVPAALLAGAAVDWLRYHAAALIVPVFLVAGFEAGFAGNPLVATMPTALPQLDNPIAADHSSSIVVDVPFSLRGGVPLPWEGPPFNPEDQVLATADGHPRAVGYFSRLPPPTLTAIRRNAFYAGLLTAEGAQSRQISEASTGTTSYRALLAAARTQAKSINVGWVLIWQQTPYIERYLARTGFRLAYQADGVLVYRPAALVGKTPAGGAATTAADGTGGKVVNRTMWTAAGRTMGTAAGASGGNPAGRTRARPTGSKPTGSEGGTQ